MHKTDKIALSLGVLGTVSYAFYHSKLRPKRVYAEEAVPPAKFPWTHDGFLSSYDHAR